MRRRPFLVSSILLVGLILRLIFVLKVAPDLKFGDQTEYLEGAQRLLSGTPLPVKNWMFFVRAPGYSALIAAVWWLTGAQSLEAIKVANALLGTAMAGYVYLIGRRLGGERAGLIALVTAVIYPYFVFGTGRIATETAFSACVAGGAYHLASGVPSDERLAPSQLLLGSFLLALGNMLRPNLSTILPFLGLWFLWRYRHRLGLVATGSAAFLAPLLAVSLPWTFAVANQGLGWIWVTDGGGVYYFMGHNDEAHRLFCEDTPLAERKALLGFPGYKMFSQRPLYRQVESAAPPEQQALFWKAALDWDKANLSKLPCLTVTKFVNYWRPWVNPIGYSWPMVLVSLSSLPVLALGLYGLREAFLTGERALTIFTAISVLAGTLVAVVFSTEIRYRVPVVDVLLTGFFGYALDRLYRRYQEGKSP